MTGTSAKLMHCFTLLCVILSYTPAALPQGQTTGAIQGRAEEVGTNAPIAKAIITVRNQDSGFERTTVTAADGTYTLAILPPGLYTIEIAADGYEGDSLPNFPVRLSKINMVQPPPFTLKKRGAATPVASAPPVQQPKPQSTSQTTDSQTEQLTNAANATRGGNFDRNQLLSLPLPGIRTFDSLAFLVPGVSEPPEPIGKAVGPGIGAGVGTLGQFSVNGNRSPANNFTIDGSDNNDQDVGVRRQGFFALTPQPMETLQEFRISTLLWDSEFGRNPGSQVNAVSRGGSNDFHGQLYSFFTDSSLNARNAFDFEGGPSGGKDDNTRVQSGFAIGGPIVRNRMQFFGGFEYLHLNATSEQHFATPTLAERSFPGASAIGIDATRRLGFGIIVGGASTPLGQNLLGFYPPPNNPAGPYGANNLTRVLPADGRGKLASFRLTDQIASNHQLSGRYNFTDDNLDLPSIRRAIDSAVTSHTRTQDFSLILDSSFSSSLVNQARFSFGRTRLNFSTGTLLFNGETLLPSDIFAFDADINQISLPPFFQTSKTGPFGQLAISPFSPVGLDVFLFPQSRANNTFQYADTLSEVWGDHSLKFGADIRRVQSNSLQNRNYRSLIEINPGLNVIDGGFSVVPAIQMATLGITSALQTLTLDRSDSIIGLRFNELNFFFNDNWRIRRNVTLDYGLRYEYNSVPHEVNNRIEDALQLKNLPKPGGSALDSPRFSEALRAAVNAYQGILDGRTNIYEPDAYNFAPHFGFAWDPRSNGKTAIRGGAGVYFDTILGFAVSQSRNVFPNEIPIVTEGGGFFPTNGIASVNPSLFGFCTGSNCSRFIPIAANGTQQLGGNPQDKAALIGALLSFTTAGGGLAFTLPEKKLRMPRVYQWHLTIEQQLLKDLLVSAAYVGTLGRNLPRLTTPNLGAHLSPVISLQELDIPNFGKFDLLSSSASLDLNRPIPELGAFQIYENSAPSSYNALQFEARKRYSRGFTFTAAYTWSHAIDEVSDIVDTAGSSALPQTSVATQAIPSPTIAERGNASFDVRHRFAASMIWDLPFYRGSTGGAARWLGGWQLTSIFQARSGQPYTLILPFDDNLDGNLTDRPAGTTGLTFFDGHSSRRVSLAPGTTINDLNLNLSPDFHPGAARIGRNTFRGDSLINLDVALNKNFRFTESQNLQFRTEFFNLLNRANFGIPIRVIGAPGFGSSVDTVSPARVIQFALKYQF